MRNLWWLLAFVFLLGCSVHTDQSPNTSSDHETSLRESLDRIVNRQLAREHFSFSIILEDHSDYRFVGEQTGADWTLKSQGSGEPIEVKKKGNRIELTQEKTTEKLSERQFGLISPRDHLILLQEAAGRVKALPARDQGIHGMEIDLDKGKIGQIVEQQMGSRKAGREIAQHASRKLQVRYRLWYRIDNQELTRMEIHVDSTNPSPDQEKRIRYIFRNP